MWANKARLKKQTRPQIAFEAFGSNKLEMFVQWKVAEEFKEIVCGVLLSRVLWERLNIQYWALPSSALNVLKLILWHNLRTPPKTKVQAIKCLHPSHPNQKVIHQCSNWRAGEQQWCAVHNCAEFVTASDSNTFRSHHAVLGVGD